MVSSLVTLSPFCFVSSSADDPHNVHTAVALRGYTLSGRLERQEADPRSAEAAPSSACRERRAGFRGGGQRVVLLVAGELGVTVAVGPSQRAGGAHSQRQPCAVPPRLRVAVRGSVRR